MTAQYPSLPSTVGKCDLLDAAAFAERLGWTPQRLDKALKANRVFFVEHDGQRFFPAFLADPRYERRQLDSVCKLLGHIPGDAKLLFFLNSRGSLSKLTPLQGPCTRPVRPGQGGGRGVCGLM